jgi:hypothetical protein
MERVMIGDGGTGYRLTYRLYLILLFCMMPLPDNRSKTRYRQAKAHTFQKKNDAGASFTLTRFYSLMLPV